MALLDFNRTRKIAIYGKKLSEEHFSGAFRSVFKGQGLAFDSVRPYNWGDDTRAIDWRVTARLGQPHIKTFIEERRLRVYFLIDTSSSVFDITGSIELKESMASFCATVGFSALSAGELVGAAFFDERINKFIRSISNHNQVRRIIAEIFNEKENTSQTSLSRVFEEYCRIQKKRSIVFILSDFFSANFESSLAKLALRHDAIAVVLKSNIENVPPKGIYPLSDAESGELRLIALTGDKQIESLRHLLIEREEYLRALFRKLKIDMLALNPQSDYLPDLLRLFRERNRKIA